MDFARRRYEYKTEYTKQQAVRLLKQEDRVKSVHITKTGMMIIKTIPLIPKGYGFDEIALGSIGSYVIRISGRNKLCITIKRLEGSAYERWHHWHINTAWDDKVCWGSVEKEIYEICRNKDWFWAAKRCLDLVWDCFPEKSQDYDRYVYRLIKFQETVNPKLKKALKKGEKILMKRLVNKALEKEGLKFCVGDRVRYRRGMEGIIESFRLSNYDFKTIRYIRISVKKASSRYKEYLNDDYSIFPNSFKYIKKLKNT